MVNQSFQTLLSILSSQGRFSTFTEGIKWGNINPGWLIWNSVCGQTLWTDRGCCVCQVAFLGRLRRSWLHPKSGFSRKVIHMRIRGCMVNEPLLNIPEHSFFVAVVVVCWQGGKRAMRAPVRINVFSPFSIEKPFPHNWHQVTLIDAFDTLKSHEITTSWCSWCSCTGTTSVARYVPSLRNVLAGR